MLRGEAPASPRLAAALSFLKQLNDVPDSVDTSSIEPLHALGIGDSGIIDLVMICFGFNLIDRVADALAFDLPVTGFEREARFAWTFGYRLSSGKWFRWPRPVDTSKGAQALVDALLSGWRTFQRTYAALHSAAGAWTNQLCHMYVPSSMRHIG